ncbi:MAG: copper-translocating P-type ATPase [Chloroflexi bacterium]|nr:copper-translocating P-type ATPase [Chloroflexota bacterium]MDA1145260.1 copper-translocating P-type ATPase [Chloroflexota bacterium]
MSDAADGGHGSVSGTDAHAGHAAPNEQSAPGGHAGHDRHAGHGAHGEIFRRRFWGTLLLSIPVFIFSETIQGWLHFSTPEFQGDRFIPAIFGTAIFVYGGPVFLRGGWGEVQDRRPGMMSLISMAISVAFVASVLSLFEVFELEFWWELAGLIVVMLFGHWQEMRALGQASGALEALAALLPDEAELVTPEGTRTVAAHELVTGDVVLVRPGAGVPADGEIVEGEAEFDESMLTGESRPVLRGVGDRVVASAVVAGTAVRVRVVAVGDDTALAGIERMVRDAQASRSRAQALADRAAALLFYVAVVAGLVTLIAWSIAGNPGRGVIQMVGVLVIACPHALGLAIPLVIALATGLSARNGLLVKDRIALERMRNVQAVLFDKTGTLTAGNHVVTSAHALDGDEDALFALAGAVESDSEHPLARAIVTAARERGPIPAAADFRADAGRGARAIVDGVEAHVGGPALLRDSGFAVPAALLEATAPWEARGATVLHVVRAGQVIGALALEDEIRSESRAAVAELHRLGVRVGMITGDSRAVANAVAAELGIDEVFAEVLPEDKDRAVRELQARGLTVAMVGDGVNDAPALARADIGIAIGAGTDVAIQSAGIVLASDDPRGVVTAIRLSRASYRKMIQNLVWAAGYNIFAIPLAAGVLAPWGFILPPAVAALLMSLSTVIVALNAQLLRRVVLTPAAIAAPATAEAHHQMTHA